MLLFSVLLLVAIYIWVVLQHLYRAEQMTGKTAKFLTMWRKVKEKAKPIMGEIKKWWQGLAKDTKVFIALLVAVIIAVIWICGIKGNNDQNFYYHPKEEKVAWTFPTKPNVPITKSEPVDTSQLRKGINIVKGKLVIKTT